MTLDLRDCTFSGPALPEPFVQFELAAQLAKLGVLVKIHDKDFERDWGALRRQFRSRGGPQSVCNHVVAPLAECLGFDHPARQDDVATREGMEDGGWLMQAPCGARLRAWPLTSGMDLDAPHRTGRAYRFSPMRSAQRVLLASGERLGFADRWRGAAPAAVRSRARRTAISRSRSLAARDGERIAWRPISYRLVLALAAPRGIAALPECWRQLD